MRYEILGILISCYLTFIQHAFGFPDEPLQPLNELGVTLDYSLAKWAPPGNWNARQIPRNYLLSSHITFNGPVNQITDAHLWKLAIVAYSYLEPDIVQYEIDTTNTPGALTILAWGNEIILASSQKGYNSYTYQGKESKVSKILEKCQATYLEKVPGGQARRHRTKGKCGEKWQLICTTSFKTFIQLAVNCGIKMRSLVRWGGILTVESSKRRIHVDLERS